MTDPLEAMAARIAGALIKAEVPTFAAWVMAEELVHGILHDLDKAGAPVGHYLRRVKVYRLKCCGVSPSEIAKRMGVSRKTVHEDYNAELLRRRRAA